MGVRDSIRAYNGMITWINKNQIDIGVPKKKTHRAIDNHINAVLHKFGKAHGIEMEKNNSPRYKGSYSPMMSNAVRVQENWKAFTIYMKENYNEKGKEVL